MRQPFQITENGKIVVRVDAHLEKILPDFLERRRREIVSMQEVLRQKDCETLRVFGHRMKGTGGSYGLDTITEIGDSLEQAAKKQDFDRMSEVLRSFAYFLEHVEVVYRDQERGVN